MKVSVAFAAALACVSASPAPGAYLHDEAAIVLVGCIRPGGNVTGSAFKVGPDTYITAEHVVSQGVCFVAGQRVTVTSTDERTDYATFTGPASPAVLRTTCAGFKPGRTYVARGYPGGGSYNIFAPWQAVNAKIRGFQVFMAADSIPGMSGGPLLDETGAAVGVVSMRWPARSMPLKGTTFCGLRAGLRR